MMNQKTIKRIQTLENTEEISKLLEEEFSQTKVDEDVIINIMLKDINNTIIGFSSEKNYGFTPTTLHINGKNYKLSKVIDNLRFAVEKLKLIQRTKKEKRIKLVLNETDLPEFLSDEQLMELLNYSKSTVSTKRSRGELPQKNTLGMTSKANLFKMLRENTPGYMTAEEKIQQKVNKRRRR